MKHKPIIVIGAGGHSKVLIDTLLQQNVNILGIVDSDQMKIGQSVLKIKIVGDDFYINNYDPLNIDLVNGLGSVAATYLREKIYMYFKEQGYFFRSVIHSSAVISQNAVWAEGVQVMAGAVIQAGCHIGNNTIINTRTSIDHDCRVLDHVHIAPGCVLSGNVSVGFGAHIGTGTTVIQEKKIGNRVLVGAGSLVLQDIKSNLKFWGVPAREVKK